MMFSKNLFTLVFCLFSAAVFWGCSSTPNTDPVRSQREAYTQLAPENLAQLWARDRNEALFLTLAEKLNSMAMPDWESKQFLATRLFGQPDASSMIQMPLYSEYVLPGGQVGRINFKAGKKKVDYFVRAMGRDRPLPREEMLNILDDVPSQSVNPQPVNPQPEIMPQVAPTDVAPAPEPTMINPSVRTDKFLYEPDPVFEPEGQWVPYWPTEE